jgi:hypothetical protein
MALVDDEDDEGNKRIDVYTWDYLVQGAKWLIEYLNKR